MNKEMIAMTVMNEPYMLKYKQSEETLQKLNRGGLTGFERAIEDIVSVSGKDEVIDMVEACWSGKKIVNPMSPEEEFRKWRNQLPDSFWGNTAQKPSDFVDKAIELIAKKHPDVRDWLKDGEKGE